MEGGADPTDAPRGHISFTKVSYSGSIPGREAASFKFTRTDGSSDPFQTTQAKCGGSKAETLRIARLCYIQFEKGKSKAQVALFRSAEYENVKKNGPLVVDDAEPEEAEEPDDPNDAPRKHEAWKKVGFQCSKELAMFKWKEERFQTTVGAAGSVDACMRICRLCYLEFEKGKSKKEVLAFRDAEYEKLGGTRIMNQAHGDEDLDDSFLNKILTDVPADHVAHQQVTQTKDTSGDEDVICFQYKHSGQDMEWRMLVSKVGSAKAALRIGRLIYAWCVQTHCGPSELKTYEATLREKFHKDSPSSLLKYRKSQNLGSQIRHRKTNGEATEKKSKIEKGAELSKQELLKKLLKKIKDAGHLQGTVMIEGRNQSKKNSFINGVYTKLHVGFEDFPAYEKWVDDSEDEKSKCFIFYSTEKQRWKVSNALDDSKMGFAWRKVKKEKATTPSEIPDGKAWSIYDGKEQGYQEDTELHCRPASVFDEAAIDEAANDSSSAESSSSDSKDSSSGPQAASDGEDLGTGAAQKDLPSVSQTRKRVAAKMMVRCGLRCPKTFEPLA